VAETHEPSYYEIALTNRQVIVAFVILLVCLLSAFLSGVWIGREGTARAAEEQVVRNQPLQAAEEGRSLEELEFFDARGRTADEKKSVALPEDEAPAPPRPEATTLQEDVAGDAGGSPGGATAAETSADDEPEPASTADDAGAAEPAPVRRREEPRETAPPIPKGSVVIQVFSSAERSQAERIRERLVGGGYQAYLSPVEVGGHTMYRVRLGPYPSRADALKVAEEVRKGYKLDTWVTE
jgi:cell division septation protein DedD